MNSSGNSASSSSRADGNRAVGWRRWWVYQRERFPIAAHGSLILAFSLCAICLSRMLRGAPGWPSWTSALTAFVTCFLFFLQLRIADEFKDFEDDSRHRPYRPVPRGLVQLSELRVVFILACLLQLGLALALRPRMALLLWVPWVYLAAMSKEFFARDWLKARPITYLWTHMLVMPLIDLYATGCDWFAQAAALPGGLGWFLAASFFNGVIIEIGRKIRSPADEETGVETYSVLWGRRGAVCVWWAMMGATALCAGVVAVKIQFAGPVLTLLGIVGLSGAVAGARFCRHPAPGRGNVFERLSGVWTLALYFGLGVVPLLWRNWHAR